MFNAERLLGKIVGEVVGGASRGGGKSMLGGSGLMTMIGLGVGAFEILKQQQEQKSQAPPPPPGGGTFAGGAPPPPPPGAGTYAPPPPSMAGTMAAPAPPTPGAVPPVAPPSAAPAAAAPVGQELAMRMIQVMVAAAHADGTMDEAEERAVLDKLRGADLSQEERMFLLDELHRPKSIDQLTAGIIDPSTAKAMYMLAAAAIEIDTEAERSWLDQLARRLGLSREMQAFIEEQR